MAFKYNYEPLAIARSSSGDGTAIIAAVGTGKRIVILDWVVWLDDPSTSETVTFKMGNFTFPATLMNSTRPSFGISSLPESEWRTNENAALYVNLSGTTAVSGVIRYYITSSP